MMRSTLPLVALMTLLSACGDSEGTNPVTTGPDDDEVVAVDPGVTEDGDTSNAAPDVLRRNLSEISYDSSSETLTVTLTSLDAGDVEADYVRNAALDVPGYEAYSAQDDALDRMFVAVVAESADGSVTASAVGDGGQFGRYFSGGYYTRADGAALPTDGGLVSYAGTYAGISNLDDTDQDQVLPVPAGTDPSVVPDQPRQVTGAIFLNVDFGDGAVNGVVYDRQYTDGETLDDVRLVDGALDDSGEFLGTAEMSDVGGPVTAGTFGGVVGDDGSAVAGILQLDTIYVPSDVRDSPFDEEIGIFVLPRCGVAGAPAICDEVDDFD